MLVHIFSDKTTSFFTPAPNHNQVQPNAIDLRLNKVFRFVPDSVFELTEDGKQHRKTVEVRPTDAGIYVLREGAYEISFEGEVTVGPDEAGIVVTRSTLIRNGLLVASGLYDSGYKGPLGAGLHIGGGMARIAKGARIGQFLVWKAESLFEYDGSYGTGKPHDVKYV